MIATNKGLLQNWKKKIVFQYKIWAKKEDFRQKSLLETKEYIEKCEIEREIKQGLMKKWKTTNKVQIFLNEKWMLLLFINEIIIHENSKK